MPSCALLPWRLHYCTKVGDMNTWDHCITGPHAAYILAHISPQSVEHQLEYISLAEYMCVSKIAIAMHIRHLTDVSSFSHVSNIVLLSRGSCRCAQDSIGLSMLSFYGNAIIYG